MYKTMTKCLDKNARPTTEELQKIPSFIFCRWLSGHPGTIRAANNFNRYNKIPIDAQWKVIQSAFGGKIKYIPYPKNTKANEERLISMISKEYNISYEKAVDYNGLMDESQKEKIFKKYERVL